MEAQDSEVVGARGPPTPRMQSTDQPPTIPFDAESESSTLPTVPSGHPADAAQSGSWSPRLVELQDATLRFFANASNETLGACAVGLCASTYLVLGRVGLILIGAVGGVVLHATWEHGQHAGEDEAGRQEAAKRRREQGFELTKRALEWRERVYAGAEHPSPDKVEPSTVTEELDYTSFRPETKQALTEFTDAVMRDYVKWWYSPILPTDNAFPTSCRQILTGFLLSFSKHISRRRTEDPFLDFIANSTSIVIVFLNELGTALKASPNQDVATAIKTYLEHEPESSLANVLSSQQQERKLRLIADDVLQTFLDSKTYNCAPAQIFLREVLAVLILQATIQSCSKAEWINRWIISLLEDGEPEILNVIDAGVETLSGKITQTDNTSMASTEDKKHQRRISRAEEAMQEAMREAQRLNEMIAEDDARRRRGEQSSETGTETEVETTLSAATTDAGIPTPTSSDSDLTKAMVEPVEDSMMFDTGGNHVPTGTTTPADSLSPVRQKQKQKPFTSFDDLAPVTIPTALKPETNPPSRTEAMSAIPLTLHNASITLLDMGEGNDRISLKQKPNDEFLVQIEPASSRFPGWMVTRRYPDFEPLHETLRRIAAVSGVPEFNINNATVPAWKGQTRSSLISQLEIYLRQALKHERLAESEAMKKFLDKDVGLHKVPTANKNVLLQGAAALDNVGKGFINVLGQGGKGIAGGGKAVLGGVQGVFGAVGSAVGGPKRPSPSSRLNTSESLPTPSSSSSTILNSGRPSLDFVGTADAQDETPPPLPSRMSTSSIERIGTPPRTTALPSDEILHLPPTPSEIGEEFVPTSRRSESSHKIMRSVDLKPSRPATPTPVSHPTGLQSPSDNQLEQASAIPIPANVPIEVDAPTDSDRPGKKHVPLTDEETRITVDLIFAIITSMYSLSSAWTFRLSLLSAAKAFLLRPNNPQLESIRMLLQESLINNNTTDAAIAAHVRKLRENSLPTAEELATWPKESAADEKEKVRVKARKLLVQRGMPQALTSVMGQAASGEALGKVFDCLQVEQVARGLVFAVLLQAMRAVMQ